MGNVNVLLNFRELAQLEEREPKVVEMIDRFEATQSDFIKDSLLSSLSFIRLFGDVAQLYFPTMLDIAVLGMSDNPQPAGLSLNELQNQSIEGIDLDDKTPDQGGQEPPLPNIPGADGPTPV